MKTTIQGYSDDIVLACDDEWQLYDGGYLHFTNGDVIKVEYGEGEPDDEITWKFKPHVLKAGELKRLADEEYSEVWEYSAPLVCTLACSTGPEIDDWEAIAEEVGEIVDNMELAELLIVLKASREAKVR